jgi:hypothetical protein
MALLWNLQDVDDTLWLAKQNPSRGRTGVWRGTIVICCLRTDGWCGSKHIHSVGGGGGGGGGSSGGGGCNIVHTGIHFISILHALLVSYQETELRPQEVPGVPPCLKTELLTSPYQLA